MSNTWILVARPNRHNKTQYLEEIHVNIKLDLQVTQKYLTDYNENFAPAIRISNFRFTLELFQINII